MILITVGRTLPFDRLIRLVDQGVEAGLLRGAEFFAQIGEGSYVPKHFDYVRMLSADEMEARMSASRAIVGHAGIGTIMSAAQRDKPLIVVPRMAGPLRECVDDHQLETARSFSDRGHVLMAETVAELADCVARLDTFVPQPRRPKVRSLSNRIGSFISEAPVHGAPAMHVS